MNSLRSVFLAAVCVVNVSVCSAADIYVDPEHGNDAAPDGPVKTIRRAIALAQPGDTIHLQPIVYRDYAGFYGKQGEPGQPIILDGHGATLEGSDPLIPEQWEEVEPGLFRCDELLPYLGRAMLSRWFFLWDGKMIHMGRTSKGTSAPLKPMNELQPQEWTFVAHPDDSEVADDKRKKADKITGAFYLKLSPGQKLADANIFVPVRSAGVQFSGAKPKHNAHLIIRNLTATHPYNDGFNIHGHCEDVKFEDIRAIECGDDGISAHETAEYTVDGFVSIGNSTGICDTGASRTSYNRVFIRDCLAFDLYFLDTGRYSVTNSVVLSSSHRPLYVTGRDNVENPCALALENVLIRRVTSANEVRISANSVFEARHVTLLGLNFQATGGTVRLHDSVIAGVPAATDFAPTYDYIVPSAVPRDALIPEVLLWKDVDWTADRNQYQCRHLRRDQTFFTHKNFAEYQQQSGQDQASQWSVETPVTKDVGADLRRLRDMVPAFVQPLP